VTQRKPREIAVNLLLERESSSVPIESLLARELPGLEPSERHLCQELVFGVCRQRALLDWLIARKSRQPALRPALATLLRLGLYQLFWLDRIPDHAVVYETVELARHKVHRSQSGFVNALLRAYSRERTETRRLIDQLKIDRPHLGYSHPRWLCDRWFQRWGPAPTRKLLDWNNTPPRSFARVNTLRVQPALLLDQWRQEGVAYDFIRHDWIPENSMFELKQHPSLVQLDSFQQGYFYIQDPSTLLASRILDPQPGDTILDLCAAPGGKTTHIAQLSLNQARILACDPDAARLDRLRQNCARLHVSCVAAHHLPELADSSAVPPPTIPRLGGAGFDRALIDAPCSNTGVMRRRVDLRWRVQPGEIQRLARLQFRLLHQGAAALRPGGILVYSTCSLEPEENEAVIERFLHEQPGFQLEIQRALSPFQDQTDGAYVARLRAPGGTATA
jgi:16S rRNA (cytosine967-C5)-methyltransferase